MNGGLAGEGREGEKWLRLIFLLVKEKCGLGFRTGTWEPKHSAALHRAAALFSTLPRLPHVTPAELISVLLVGLCGVT